MKKEITKFIKSLRDINMDDKLIMVLVRRLLEIDFELEAGESEIQRELEILEAGKLELKKQPSKRKFLTKELNK